MCNHEIFIKNLNNNEIIEYSTLFLKGRITNCCDLNTIKIKLNNVIQQQYCFNNLTNEFKCLIKLIDLNNHIELFYCSSYYSLNVIYKKNLSNFRIRPLYIICDGHDGNFHGPAEYDCSVNNACVKIDLGIELIQCLYAEKLNEEGFERKTFNIDSKCEIFYSKLNVDRARELSPEELWEFFGREIKTSIGQDGRIKFVAFLGCTLFKGIDDGDYSYNNIYKNTLANPALGGGGLAIFGTGCLYTWPNSFNEIINAFQDKQKINLKYLMDDSNYRRTYGGCYATNLGSVSHEIGHTFDLGHTEDGIMGSGFDFINRVFTIEIFTENLPQRITNKIQNRPNNSRFTKIKKPGEFMTKYHQQKLNDSIYLPKNCAITLNYHKWFNIFEPGNCVSSIVFDLESHLIKSEKFPFKLVELRSVESSMLVEYFSFLEEECFTFEIPERILLKNIILFAINSNGDMIKSEM